jgi:hypothetical protein
MGYKLVYFVLFFNCKPCLIPVLEPESSEPEQSKPEPSAIGAGATSHYGSGSGSGFDQMMRLLAPPAPQHGKYTF